MTSLQEVQTFLDLKRFAFRAGVPAVPVNPEVAEIDGQPCFARLQEIRPPVDGALFMTAPAVTDTLVRDCPGAGIKHVWMFRGVGAGAATGDAIRFCESQGIPVTPGECPFMFLPGGAWFHRFHGLVKKIGGSYPR
jgi:predicted CoA-binding protein